jgi:hypothetical protein
MDAPDPLDDEIRFRAEMEMKPRLKRVAKASRIRSYQAMVRQWVWEYLESEERRLGINPPKAPGGGARRERRHKRFLTQEP